MNIFHVFLGLLWVVLALSALIGGAKLTFDYAQDADYEDVPLPKALGGTLIRGVATILLVAVIVGLPLDLAQF